MLRRTRKRAKPPRILLSRVGRMGDVVAAEPIARYLKRAYPDHSLVWCVAPAFLPLVEAHPDVQMALPVRCICEPRRLAASGVFDRFFDTHPAYEPWGRCRHCAGEPAAGQIDLSNYPRFGNYLEIFLHVAGLPSFSEPSRVHIGEPARRKVDSLDLPEHYIAVSCASTEEARCWHGEAWHELGRILLSSQPARIVEIGLRPTLAARLRGVVDLAGRVGPLESAEVIRRARLFVGVDSGPAHLAGAVETPGVVLIGNHRNHPRELFESYCMFNGRYADEAWATLLRKSRLSDLAPSEVARAVLDRLSRPRPGA